MRKQSPIGAVLDRRYERVERSTASGLAQESYNRCSGRESDAARPTSTWIRMWPVDLDGWDADRCEVGMGAGGFEPPPDSKRQALGRRAGGALYGAPEDRSEAEPPACDRPSPSVPQGCASHAADRNVPSSRSPPSVIRTETQACQADPSGLDDNPLDSDLSAVVASWHSLPPEVRAGIAALIKALVLGR